MVAVTLRAIAGALNGRAIAAVHYWCIRRDAWRALPSKQEPKKLLELKMAIAFLAALFVALIWLG